jgi:hypothetical protein
MKFYTYVVMLLSVTFLMMGCPPAREKSTDSKQAVQTEMIQDRLNSKLGLPNISNGQEKRLLKELYELRDKADLSTFTYTFSEMTGELTFLGKSIGFGIPGAVQYSNPQRIDVFRYSTAPDVPVVIPQPEPNGLFMPDSVSATWVYLISPAGDVSPTYIEPTISVSLFPLPNAKYPETGPQYADLVPQQK